MKTEHAETGGKRRGRKKLRPQELPLKGAGVERKKIKELDAILEDYLENRAERMRLTPKEVEGKTKVLALMKKHGIMTYAFEDRVIKIVPKDEQLKVVKADEVELEQENEE